MHGWGHLNVLHATFLDLVMIAPIRCNAFFSFTVLADHELEPHAPNIHQLKRCHFTGRW